MMGLGIRDVLEPWTPGCHGRALVALLTAPSEAAAAELIALSHDHTPGVRAEAVLLAAEIAPELGDRLALTLLADPMWYVRCAACQTLWFHRYYPAAEPLARMLVQEPEELVRNMLAGALDALGNRSHLPYLEAALAVETGTDHEGTPIQNVIARSIEAVRSRRPSDAK